jgi:hypothetical protein
MGQETLDRNGKFIKVGNRVRVLAIPPFDPGLKKKEIARINSMLGEVFKVIDIDEYGHATVEKTWEDAPGVSHRLALKSNDMERVDG